MAQAFLIWFYFVFEFSFMNGSNFEPCLIILVTCATWLRPDSVSLRFEFSFMNGLRIEPCSDHFVACATWLRSRFGFMRVNRMLAWTCSCRMTQLLCLPQDRNRKAKFNKLVDVRSSSMLERLRRICCKSPHVSAMLFQHMIFPSIER